MSLLQRMSLLWLWENPFFTRDNLASRAFAQIAVEGVHLRYEDAVSNPAEPMAVGLCISKVTLNDAEGEKDGKQRRLDVEGVQLYRQTGALDSEDVSVPSGAQNILESTHLFASLAFVSEDESAIYLQSVNCETGALKVAPPFR
eukprot:1353066-Rhodomonas_salina.2